jgi:hypothetical protein
VIDYTNLRQNGLSSVRKPKRKALTRPLSKSGSNHENFIVESDYSLFDPLPSQPFNQNRNFSRIRKESSFLNSSLGQSFDSKLTGHVRKLKKAGTRTGGVSVLSSSNISRLDNLITSAIEVEMKEEPETPNRISELAIKSNLDP